jgi:MFS family permease
VSSAIYATCPIWVLSQLIILAIAADVMEESQRATVFLMGVSAALLGGMLAPSLASLLMARSLWLPLLLGFGILALGAFSFALIIPETLHLRRQVTGSPILTRLGIGSKHIQERQKACQAFILHRNQNQSVRKSEETSRCNICLALSTYLTTSCLVCRGTF